MNYSYTQISQYLTCPRRYRYRYLDGWKPTGQSGRNVVRACLRAGTGCTVSPRRSGRGLLSGVVGRRKMNTAIFGPRQLGSDARTRHPASHPLLPRRPHPHPPASPQPTDQGVEAPLCDGRLCCAISTPSEISTEDAVCWSGKPVRVDTLTNRRVF